MTSPTQHAPLVAVKPETEELLYYLAWTADFLISPTWRNLDESFEQWAWRNGLARRLAELHRQKLLERHPGPNLDRIVRLTEAGKKIAMGGRNPTTQWGRPWDGRWRLVLFDVPVARAELRQRFWRALRRNHFGYLQGSVWVTPDPADRLRALLGGNRVQADSLLVIEGQPAAGETDQDIVAEAWNFAVIHRRYERYLDFLEVPPPRDTRLPEWTRREIALWRNVIQIDPLLPRALLPAGYLGISALGRRQEVFGQLAEHTRRSPPHHGGVTPVTPPPSKAAEPRPGTIPASG